MATNFWENDEVIRAAQPSADQGVTPAPVPKAPVDGAPPAASGAVTGAPAPAPAAGGAANFWEQDEVVRPAPSAAPAAAAPTEPARSVGQEAGRQLGLTVRHTVNGLAALPAMAADVVGGAANAGLDLVRGEGNGFRFPKQAEALNSAMTQAGLPQPENATERVVGDIASAVAGGTGTVAVGKKLAETAASGVTRAVGSVLAAEPGVQLVSAATGGGASGLTREAGGGEGAQMAAGIAGALAPTAVPFAAKATLRGAIRGGEAGRQQMVENIDTFEKAAGVTPTLGQATQSRGIQAVETGLSNVPGGSGILARRGEAQAKALEDSVQQITRELAPDATGWGAGEAITKGVNAFKAGTKATQAELYQKLDQYIPANTQITSTRTQAALADLNADIAGAPALSAWFKNARIQGIEGGLKSDTTGIEAILSRPGMRERADALRAQLTEEAQRAEAANQRHFGNLRLQADEAVEANKAWRASLQQEAEAATQRNAERRALGMTNFEPVQTPQQIREMPDRFHVMPAKDMESLVPPNAVRTPAQIEQEVADMLRGEVDGKLPYESIKKLRTLVGNEISDGGLVADVPRSKWRALYAALSDDLGEAAKSAGPQAEQAWSRANQYTRGSMQRLEQLESIVNRDAPEKVFKAATSGLADGGTQIGRLMKSMPLENRREVTAAVLQRLGRAKNSAQNEMGEAFSAETFLTNLAAMSGPARTALFANSGFPGLRQKVEQMGKMASLRREGAQVFANPSGTARQGTMIGWGAALLGALGTGNVPAVVKLAALPIGVAGIAKATTSPKAVKFAARKTNLGSAAPAVGIGAIGQANQTEEPIYTNRVKAGADAKRNGKQVYPVDGGWAVR